MDSPEAMGAWVLACLLEEWGLVLNPAAATLFKANLVRFLAQRPPDWRASQA